MPSLGSSPGTDRSRAGPSVRRLMRLLADDTRYAREVKTRTA
jgi:hypothetical protein